MSGPLFVSILSELFIALGVVALLIGALGLLRLPDVYCRIHGVGVIDTAGAGFIILGMIIHEGISLVTVKLVLVGIFLFFTSPIATHAVAQVAYKSGVVPVGRCLANTKTPKKAERKGAKQRQNPERAPKVKSRKQSAS